MTAARRTTGAKPGLAALLIAAAAPAAATDPPCIARAELEPARAVVGQQVLWKVDIDSRDDVREIAWAAPPAFANIRTERLPGLASIERQRSSGAETAYTTRQERRALFPERAGALPIASDGLRCKLTDGAVVPTPVPTVTLQVVDVPRAGAMSGVVVGPLVLTRHVDPDAISLGESLRVTISIRGSGNLWDAVDPLAQWKPASADLFASQPALELRAGSVLSVQKLFRYDVVPRSAGRFTLPAIQLRYFDPTNQRPALAQQAAVSVDVRSPEPVEAADSTPRRAKREPEPDPSPGTRPALVVGALAAVAALSIGAAFGLARRARKSREAALPAASDDPDRDAANLARALRAALARPRGADADGVRDAEALLERLERSRFDPSARAPERAAVVAALEQLQRPRRG